MDWDFSPAAPSISAISRCRMVSAREASDSRTLAPSSATSASEAARSFSSSMPSSSPSSPRACHWLCPVIRASLRALRMRLAAQPSLTSAAAISASGRPRPPARLMETRSR